MRQRSSSSIVTLATVALALCGGLIGAIEAAAQSTLPGPPGTDTGVSGAIEQKLILSPAQRTAIYDQVSRDKSKVTRCLTRRSPAFQRPSSTSTRWWKAKSCWSIRPKCASSTSSGRRHRTRVKTHYLRGRDARHFGRWLGARPVPTFPNHAQGFWWSMIFSENRFPLFRIMVYGAAAFFPASMTSFGNASR
jgi:hypothetical protein